MAPAVALVMYFCEITQSGGNRQMDHMITIDPFMGDLERLCARILSACCQHYDSVPVFSFWMSAGIFFCEMNDVCSSELLYSPAPQSSHYMVWDLGLVAAQISLTHAKAQLNPLQKAALSPS